MREALSAPNIRVTGWMPRQKTLAMLAGLDVFLMTSKMEACPLSLLEAMGLGRVCVAGSLPVFAEIIRDGENGFIAPTEDAFEDIMQALVDGRHDLAAVGAAARADVLELHTAERSCLEYAAVYREAYARKHNLWRLEDARAAREPRTGGAAPIRCGAAQQALGQAEGQGLGPAQRKACNL